MCGIAGWLDFKKNLEERTTIANKMLKTLSHRGPDDQGLFVKRNICLLHRRLVVVDPDNGSQPMTLKTASSSYTIVYNGELYNTSEIRDVLKTRGHCFLGHSDTEVVLHAFAEWGEFCVDRFNGIFAFALWNESKQELFLARDRIGVKPLFFFQYNDGLLFASEIKALLANPLVKPEIDSVGLRELFLIGPGRSQGQCIIKNIKELLPGEYAFCSKDLFRRKKYWFVQAKEFNDSKEKAIEKTRFLITDSIQSQLISDKPLCCLLSGGLDSSIISKIASQSLSKQNKQLTSYSVDYPDNDKFFQASLYQPNSDDHYIKVMVKDMGSMHKRVLIDNQSLFSALSEAVLARDLPGMADVDSSLLLFCREIKKDFTVALSGECADELFGGYPWYHNKSILFEPSFPWSRSLSVRKSLLKKDLFNDADEYVAARYKEVVNQTSRLPSDSLEDARMREMFTLNFNCFMQTLLDRKDRMSMRNGLEVRVPFCDYRIVEYAYNMPWHIKALFNREKGIVREAMRGVLPEEILFRKKSPYPKTHNPLYLRLVCDAVSALLKDKTSILPELLNCQAVDALIKDPDSVSDPWYGQLMKAPQILAYLFQIHFWFKQYNINIV